MGRAKMEESRRRKRKKRNSGSQILTEYLVLTLIFTAFMLFLTQKVIINARVPSPSMEPTIMTQDQLFGNRLAYWNHDPERYDIIIFIIRTMRPSGLSSA